jgi:uncharacterized SAM-binding protein YcdF (DUF218 family)
LRNGFHTKKPESPREEYWREKTVKEDSSLRRSRAVVGALVGTVVGLLSKDLALADLVSYWGDRTPLVFLFAALGALAWQWRWSRLGALVSASLLACLWLLVAYTPLTAYLGKDLPRREAPQQADAVFVLASNLQNDGEMTSVALARLLKGLELLQEGYAPRLILSELYPPNASYRGAAAPLMGRLKMTQELLTVGPVYNTHDEAEAVAKLFREKGWTRLLLVTSPAHSRRAAGTFEKQGIEVISVPAPETRYDLERLEEADDRINAFGSLAHEWLGLWLYQRRGWL